MSDFCIINILLLFILSALRIIVTTKSTRRAGINIYNNIINSATSASIPDAQTIPGVIVNV